MATLPPARRRTFLTHAQKLQLKAFWAAHPELQLLAVADWARERFGVGVGRATLYRIYHTPATAFAGRGQRKKRRRVKFPALERDLLAYCEAQRQLHSQRASDAALTDDELLRAAAELRARHGISESELKLSNGWLYRFKERHAMREAPQATGSTARADDVATAQAVATLAAGTRRLTPTLPADSERQRKPRATQQCLDGKAVKSPRGGVEVAMPTPVERNYAPNSVQGAPSPRPAQRTAVQGPPGTRVHSVPAIRPLTYVSANAVEAFPAAGTVNWARTGGVADASHFAVVAHGVVVLHQATYQVSVELQHSARGVQRPAAIFTLWGGTELLGQCQDCVRRAGDKTLSVLQLTCELPAQTMLRVEFRAPGAVFRQSRLVLRLLGQGERKD